MRPGLCQNIVHSGWPGVSRSLRCSAVFAYQAAEDLSALDPGADIDGAAGRLRRFLAQALMRAVLVGVAGELGQNLAEMPLAEGQDVVRALAAERAYESFGE